MDNKPYLRVLPILFLVLQSMIQTDSSGELGSIECVDGKWKVDTRLMALIMTCPLPLDGNSDSVMKMAKCAMNKLGIYDGENLSDDFMETTCSLFAQDELKDGCLEQGDFCSRWTGIKISWETQWPLFMACFLKWAMQLCNI